MPVLVSIDPSARPASIIPQYAHSPSLDDLPALLPEEVRLPQLTLCKVTTEEERGVELGRSGSSNTRPEVEGDSPIFEVHLRVLLRDFPTTSAADFEVSATRCLVKRDVSIIALSFLHQRELAG